MIRKVKNSCKKISLLHLWHSTQTVGLSFVLLFFHFDLEITLLHYWFLNKKKHLNLKYQIYKFSDLVESNAKQVFQGIQKYICCKFLSIKFNQFKLNPYLALNSIESLFTSLTINSSQNWTVMVFLNYKKTGKDCNFSLWQSMIAHFRKL